MESITTFSSSRTYILSISVVHARGVQAADAPRHTLIRMRGILSMWNLTSAYPDSVSYCAIRHHFDVKCDGIVVAPKKER